MSQITYRGNLSATNFPLISTLHGRTVIVKGQDQTYIPAVTAKEDTDKDSGIPQIYFAENILPHAQGFQGVGYTSNAGAVVPAVTTFTSIHPIADSFGNTGFIALTSAGDFYTLQFGDATPIFRLAVPTGAGKRIYVAHTSGTSYIYISGIGCYKYDFYTQLITSVTLTGLVAADVLGLASYGGYLIAWTADTIAWSSLIDPTDFTPSLATGAGGGSVEGVIGSISFLSPHSQGFYVYAYGNIVVGIASGNTRYPFNFKPLAGAGGCQNPELTVIRANSSSQYAYTTYGVQLVTSQGVQSIFPEVTDFLAGGLIEEFNSTTNELTQVDLSVPMVKKLTVVSNRYLVLSYGQSELNYALIYDTQQKRWGKLKITHVDCFEYNLEIPEAVESPKKSLAFLLSSGQVKLVDTSLHNANADGILILGKFQYVRSRYMQLQSAALENIYNVTSTKCYDLATLDGKTFLPEVEGTLNETNSNLIQTYYFRVTGMNHSLLLKGAFHIVSVVLTFNIHGSR